MTNHEKFKVLLDSLVLDNKAALADGELKEITIDKNSMIATVCVTFPNVLPIRIESKFRQELVKFFVEIQKYTDCNLVVDYVDKTVSDEVLKDYYQYLLDYYSSRHSRYGILNTFNKVIENQTIKFYCAAEEDKVILEQLLNNFSKAFTNYGLDVKVEVSLSPFEQSLSQKIENNHKKNDEEVFAHQKKFDSLSDEAPDKENKFRNKAKPKVKAGINGKAVPIESLPKTEVACIEHAQQYGNCEFAIEGEITNATINEFTSKDKSKKYKIYSATIIDKGSCILAKTFISNVSRYNTEDFYKNQAVNGYYAKIFGYVNYDKYARDVVFNIIDMIITGKAEENTLVVRPEYNRTELHAHTKMSEMDGVMEVKDYVQRASDYGYSALAVTDHYNIQVLPDFYNECKKRDIKPIFGVEGVLVDEKRFKVALTDDDILLDDATYVVYDLETTGLSSNYDEIIEIAACKVHRGQIIDEFSEYVKPNRSIDEFITNLTSITNEDVKNAPSIGELMPKFLEFIKGCVLVAHNATFDNSHIYANMKRLGLYNGEVFSTIDTLQLLRVYYGSRLKKFNLEAMCKFFDVELVQHHRAIYDARATAGCFIRMLFDLLDEGVNNYNMINNKINPDEVYKLLKPTHFCILSKNPVGKKNLYKIISDSHTVHFAKEPCILKSFLEEHREGLLIGSGCANGAVFETAFEKSYEELLEVMSFYDYIEIQPLDLYDAKIDKGNPVLMRKYFKETVLTIIKAAKELGKLIVVTSDIHHLNKEDKIYREIYVNAPLVGGGRHPLANMEEIPSYHFRSQEELFADFSFLDQDEAYQYIITNPNKIADMVEKYDLFPKQLFAPQDDFLADRGIPSIKEATIKMTYDAAYAQYGNPLPPIIKDRIEKELNSIIGNKFAPIYYIAYMLVDYSKKAGYVVGSRGSVGSSVVAYLMGITEVNGLAPHYYCPHCHFMAMKYTKEEKEKYGLSPEQEKLDPVLQQYGTGYDLPEAVCPICGEKMKQGGVDIPFETFLGFEGDKTPDIDLNFSGDFQAQAHEFTRTIFGVDRAFRAGTIGTVAEKTAFGYAKGYAERKGVILRNSEIERLAKNIQDVKRVTGQHPGGIVVIPKEIEYTDVIPVQYPANDTTSAWRTTHFDYHKFENNLLKLDILGHDDPTMIRHLMDFVHEYPEDFPFDKVEDIPLSDREVFKLFNGLDSLGLTPQETFGQVIGTTGIPEFGTKLAKDMLSEIRPKTVDSLLKISGLSHGTNVWNGNARDFMLGLFPGYGKIPFEDLIGCRDDIMVYLMSKNVPASDAFSIMETVRKHKGLSDSQIKEMKDYGVPDWYIESCKLIEYMFPKAHATAYVIMALRIGWFKVYRPIYYYAGYFSRRADAYDVEAMAGGFNTIRSKLNEIKNRIDSKSQTVKDDDLYNTLLLAIEYCARGFTFEQIDINRSLARDFRINPDKKSLLMPFDALDGLGESVGKSIEEAREASPFTSKQDVLRRTKLNSTQFEKLNSLGAFKDLPESDQIGLF